MSAFLAILLLRSRKPLIEYVPGMLIVKCNVECVCVSEILEHILGVILDYSYTLIKVKI